MIKYEKLDVTTVTSGIVGHGVNCQAKMGSGVALAIRNKFKKVYHEYVDLCESYEDRSELLGICQIVDVDDALYIGNCFTQEFYGNDGKPYADTTAIEESLSGLICFGEIKQLPVYIPKIGCGLGGLSWETDVLPIVEKLLEEYPKVDITICSL